MYMNTCSLLTYVLNVLKMYTSADPFDVITFNYKLVFPFNYVILQHCTMKRIAGKCNQRKCIIHHFPSSFAIKMNSHIN